MIKVNTQARGKQAVNDSALASVLAEEVMDIQSECNFGTPTSFPSPASPPQPSPHSGSRRDFPTHLMPSMRVWLQAYIAFCRNYRYNILTSGENHRVCYSQEFVKRCIVTNIQMRSSQNLAEVQPGNWATVTWCLNSIRHYVMYLIIAFLPHETQCRLATRPSCFKLGSGFVRLVHCGASVSKLYGALIFDLIHVTLNIT